MKKTPDNDPSSRSTEIGVTILPSKDGVWALEGQLFDIGGDLLLTAEQLAARLNVAPKTIRKWRYERVLPNDCMVKLRHQVRYRWQRVLRWLQTQEG